MIHSENPFTDPLEERDPVRRFRGRLTNPVTIVTSGSAGDRTGLTVSSLMVAEGEPGTVHLIVGPTSDLWAVVGDTGRFVIHICRSGQDQIAQVFAGLRPSPGGLFATVDFTDTGHGPVLSDLPDRLYCSLRQSEELGNIGLLIGSIDEVDLSDLTDPLVHFRGRYRHLD